MAYLRKPSATSYARDVRSEASEASPFTVVKMSAIFFNVLTAMKLEGTRNSSVQASSEDLKNEQMSLTDFTGRPNPS